MRQKSSVLSAFISVFALVCMMSGCFTASEVSGDPRILLDSHDIIPDFGDVETQIAAGVYTGEALQQPIQFPHYTHTSVLGMDCQYCHSEARRSKHAGVPPTQTCYGCHNELTGLVADDVEVQKIHTSFNEKKAIAWRKVHDAPDFVYFNHRRHITAEVNCTECHGQVPLQGKPNAEGVVEKVFVRETTMQMGWCLQCHSSHPSITTNYCGEGATEDCDASSLRRAELKDCWACHM